MFDNRPLFIKPIHRETSIQNGNSQIGKTSDETQRLGFFHRFNRCIPTRANTSSIQEVSSLRTRRSSISLFGPTVRNVPKSVNFFETDGRYCSFSTPTCHIRFSIPRRLADKKSDSQPTDYSDKLLHSNYPKPRFSAKSQEVRSLSCSEIHLHRCHTKKVNPISAPITVIAHFLIFLFSEKKCQISTIKGYRSMISNTLKFKTGNRIGSNPVLSELIRSFELQQPVQRSLTPKWDLSWVLVCLQKPPFEPLDKASKLHVTIKTAFLLALATAKRCSEIHALAMDSQHLRFNQSDGSVSLILKSGFLAKKNSFLLLNLLLFLVLLEYVNGNILTDFLPR